MQIIFGRLYFVPLCAVARPEDAQWDYEDVHSWGAHSTGKACAFGGQLPVDLTGAINAKIRAPNLSWKPQAFTVVNNGHTIQVNAAPGSFATSENGKFELKQFDFHTPSEQAIDGKREPMEAHLSMPRKAATCWCLAR